MKTAFLVIATVLTVISVLPYIRDILRHRTRPNIVSWLTWSLLTGIATAAEVSAHEYITAIFTGAATFETAIVVLLGLHYGFVKYARFDIVCQLAAIVGIILWQVFDSPAVAVFGAVLIDLIGGLPTLKHAWLKPHEETWQTFALSGVGSVFGVLALHSYNWVSLPYILYLVLANSVLTLVIVLRRAA
ncbi:MAG: hypothetical protein ACREGB_05165 [Candidatus Saccharimonadales bacterium]